MDEANMTIPQILQASIAAEKNQKHNSSQITCANQLIFVRYFATMSICYSEQLEFVSIRVNTWYKQLNFVILDWRLFLFDLTELWMKRRINKKNLFMINLNLIFWKLILIFFQSSFC